MHLGLMDTTTPPLTHDAIEAVLTLSELAAHLAVSVQTLYDLRSKGQGPRGIRVGRELRFRRSEVDACWVRLEAAEGARTLRRLIDEARTAPHDDGDVEADRSHQPGWPLPGGHALPGHRRPMVRSGAGRTAHTTNRGFAVERETVRNADASHGEQGDGHDEHPVRPTQPNRPKLKAKGVGNHKAQDCGVVLDQIATVVRPAQLLG